MSEARGTAAAYVRVRLAVAEDADALVEFNRAMALETESRALDPPTVARGVATVLDDPSLGFYAVAERGGDVVGGLLVTYEWSDWRNGMFLWIQSVYVAPASRGGGIYTRLHEFVREHARERGDVCGIRLYVDADNARAQRVYSRLGMTGSNYLLFEQALADES